MEGVRAIRSTSYVGGICRKKTGTNLFFIKPKMGYRAYDCFGTRGPQPEYSHIVGDGLILFSWRDERTDDHTSKLFNAKGRFLGIVEQPRVKDS